MSRCPHTYTKSLIVRAQEEGNGEEQASLAKLEALTVEAFRRYNIETESEAVAIGRRLVAERRKLRDIQNESE